MNREQIDSSDPNIDDWTTFTWFTLNRMYVPKNKNFQNVEVHIFQMLNIFNN